MTGLSGYGDPRLMALPLNDATASSLNVGLKLFIDQGGVLSPVIEDLYATFELYQPSMAQMTRLLVRGLRRKP
jgi:hypothetical protein